MGIDSKSRYGLGFLSGAQNIEPRLRATSFDAVCSPFGNPSTQLAACMVQAKYGRNYLVKEGRLWTANKVRGAMLVRFIGKGSEKEFNMLILVLQSGTLIMAVGIEHTGTFGH